METVEIVGIGLVGTALSEHLLTRGYRVIGHDIDPDRTRCSMPTLVPSRPSASITRMSLSSYRVGAPTAWRYPSLARTWRFWRARWPPVTAISTILP